MRLEKAVCIQVGGALSCRLCFSISAPGKESMDFLEEEHQTHHCFQVQQLLVQVMDAFVLHLNDKMQTLQFLLPELAGAPIILEGEKENA